MQSAFHIQQPAGMSPLTVSVDATTARRAVTRWVINNVADMLVGDTPMLVIDGQDVQWHVPVVLTSQQGNVGEVGLIKVDAQTGQLRMPNSSAEQMLTKANQLVSHP